MWKTSGSSHRRLPPPAPSLEGTPSTVFLGRFQHSVDAKGRIAIPARFRDQLSGETVITRGVDRCIALYPLTAWLPLAQKVDALPLGDPDARMFRRMVFAEAAHLELDTQGRLLLPPELRAYAGIDRETVVVGMNASIEIWSAERWVLIQAQIDDGGAAVAQRLALLL